MQTVIKSPISLGIMPEKKPPKPFCLYISAIESKTELKIQVKKFS